MRSSGYGICLGTRLGHIAKTLFILALSIAGFSLAQPVQDGSPVIAVVDVDGPIGPATSDYIQRALDTALETRTSLVVLRIDTPGGLDSSTREIVQDILASPIPVAGYVAPSGARAASAGTYILYATHFAAMAPGTNVGAATPVQIGGPSPLPGTGAPGTGDDAPPAPDTSAQKAVSDSIAYLRSLAEMRGRNADWAEAAVRDSASISAETALKLGVIELLASNMTELATQLDGRTVGTRAGQLTLDLAGAQIIAYEPDWKTRVLTVITNPNVAYILLLIGVYGLLLEFYSPGTFVAGITGAICLFLGLYALNLLPVNYAGAALLLLGIVLMASEAFVPSFGALGIGGAVAFIAGSLLLLETDAPGFEVSLVLIGTIAALASGLFLFVMWMLLRSRRRTVSTGLEELLASSGEVIDWSDESGHVRIHGEIWSATATSRLKPGMPVRVEAIDGLTLKVTPRQEHAK